MDIKKYWFNSSSTSTSIQSIRLGRSYTKPHYQSNHDGPKQVWQILWRKLKRDKKKGFGSMEGLYDPESYSMNFDHGTGWMEPDNLPRSFSSREKEEDESHLFGCPRITMLPDRIYQWTGILTVQHNEPERERNDMIFRGGVFDGEKILEEIIVITWLWLKGFESDFNMPFRSCIVNPVVHLMQQVRQPCSQWYCGKVDSMTPRHSLVKHKIVYFA